MGHREEGKARRGDLIQPPIRHREGAKPYMRHRETFRRQVVAISPVQPDIWLFFNNNDILIEIFLCLVFRNKNLNSYC